MRTKEEIDKLVEENIDLVGFTLNRYFRNFRDKFPYMVEDLYQEGSIGLFDAAKKYDKNKGKFSTIATKYIWGYMMRFTEKYVNKHYNNDMLCSMDRIVAVDYAGRHLTVLDTVESDFKMKDIRLHGIEKQAKNCGLSHMDIIIELLGEGYSYQEIGKTIGICYQDVARRLKKFREKKQTIDDLMIALYKLKTS